MADANGEIGARRALLVGCPGKDLTGIEIDIRRMRAELTARGFTCRELVGSFATRDAILGALRALRDGVGQDDAVVVYYTGHGGRCVVADGSEPRPSWSYLLPADHDFDTSFKGIADFELSAIVREISAKTPNATVILDCCHAAQICRGSGTRGAGWTYGSIAANTRGPAQLLAMPPEIAASAEALQKQRPPREESNPKVVRVVAAASGSWAYEEHGANGSVLTNVLVEALARSREQAPMSWDAIIRWVREEMIVRRRSTVQRPEVEGPRERLPFSLHTAGDMRSRLTVFRAADGTTRVDGGALHGIAVGDVLEVLESETKVASEVEVEKVEDAESIVRTRNERGSAATLVPGRVAVRRTHGMRRPVSLDAAARELGPLRERLERAPWLTIAKGDEGASLHVTLDADGLGIRGFHRHPRPTTAAGVDALIDDLEALARARVLCDVLSRPPGLGPAAGSPWRAKAMVRVGSGEPRELCDGETLVEGDQVYVEVRRVEFGGRPHYVNVIEKDVAGRVELVNRSEPSGVELVPEDMREIGQRVGWPPGLPTAWPPDVDERSLPLGHEELIVVVSLRPLDLRPLLEDFPPAIVQRGPLRDLGPEPGSRPASEAGPLPWETMRFRFSLLPRPR